MSAQAVSLLIAILLLAPPVSGGTTRPRSVLGLWAGQSICVGNRPACKNEEVVYRFEPIAGSADSVMLLADKIIEKKRVPMGQLAFAYDRAGGTLQGEFRRGNTHGLWRFSVKGDRMEGTLAILPDSTIGRRVTVRRATEKEVPAAPDRDQYGE